MIKINISDRSSEALMMLYKTLVRPIIDYCIPAWRPYLQKDIDVLERIQKRFTKLVDGCKTKSYNQRLEKLGLTSLADRHNRMDMIEVFKILKGINTAYPENFLELSDRPGRKNSLKLYKKRFKYDLCMFSFTSRVVDKWNDLPEAVVQSADVNTFKHGIDKWMRDFRGQL